ncbi:MAG: radical SAM protein [Promethearchaeota archaeon]
MKKQKFIESSGKTLYIKRRGIPKGCEYCLKGSKVVLFINGICQKPAHCSYYCPISKERRDKQITFADEIEIETKEELLEEIDKIDAKGMSITGGEPLLEKNILKTIEFIKYVKERKGKNFHIHLYTNGENFSEDIAENLSKAGLDEIRFHPAKNNWDVIMKALRCNFAVGAEVPVIPDEEEIKNLEKFILYLDKIGAEFINLNEFELCLPNSQYLKERGFQLEEGSIASVKGSREAALRLLQKLCYKVTLKIHFCPIIAKDYYQLKNRYLRRAKKIRLPYEQINKEGLLLFSQIEGTDENIARFNNFLINELNLSKKLVNLENNSLRIPSKIALKSDFQQYLNIFDLKGYLIEIIPFRGKYCQITEKTPLSVYINELKGNETY